MTTIITTKSASRVVINSPIIDTEVTVSNGPKGDPGATGPAGSNGVGVPTGGTIGQALVKLSGLDYDTGWSALTASAAWGSITGTLSAQTDLQTALNAKANTSSLAAIATSGSASDLSTGTLPAARFDDTAHGARAGGTLHSAATTSVAGFMSAADKTKLDGVATGATANSSDAFLLNRANHTGTQAAGTITGLATVATSGSATDLGTGTLPAGRMPALTGDVTTTAGTVATTIANDAVTNAKAANMAANTIKANATASTADPADLAVGTNTVVGRVAGNIVAAQLATAQVADNAIDNTKAADMATARIKGRVTAGTGDPEDLTGTQATTLLDTFTSALKGLAPASGGGTTNFLRADGAWAAPPGGGGSLTVQDEGVTLSTAVTTINFTGAGVTATGTTTVTVDVPGGGGSSLSGSATLTIPANRFEHQETVTATGVTASSRVSVWLDPATDDDENVPELTDLVTMTAAPGTNQITVTAAFDIPTSGPLKIQWSAF